MANILITGGAGYLGSKLVPQLLKNNHKIKVLDLLIYGENVLPKHKNLEVIKGDIRDIILFESCLENIDTVIHLACISNDPSFELNPLLGKTINLDPFEPMVQLCVKKKIRKFIYASSSSVYGIKKEKNVTEDMSLEPLTDYSKFKADCEKILLKYKSENFITTIVRSATLCGYAPRQRLDVIVNIFANHGYHKRELNIFGGNQLRPNIHIDDIVRFYELLLTTDDKKINGEIFNVGGKNYSVKQIAEIAKKKLGKDIKILQTHSDDNRSYHISSEKVKDLLKFEVKFDISNAIEDLKVAFDNKLLLKPLENEYYFNIKRMQSLNLK